MIEIEETTKREVSNIQYREMALDHLNLNLPSYQIGAVVWWIVDMDKSHLAVVVGLHFSGDEWVYNLMYRDGMFWKRTGLSVTEPSIVWPAEEGERDVKG